MVQLFFDANIWIDYCWGEYFSKRRAKEKRPAILIHKINSKKTRITLTLPILYEIVSHFKDYFILQEVIAHGFSVFEFSKVKRDYKLSREDRKKADEIYTKITSLPPLKDQILLDWLDDQVVDKVFKITAQYDLEFLDCLHVVAASIAKCNVFVTKDAALLDKVKLASKRFRSLNKISFMDPKAFHVKFTDLFKK